MSEWYKELEQKYIHLFEVNEDNIPVRGIEVSEGWKRITEELLERFEWIRTHNTHSNDGKEHIIKIFQIKQKFGSFVCYASVYGSECAKRQVDESIAYYKGKADYTCESCGKIGDHTKTKGWISVRCDECKDKRNEY
jgi:hypothetical protein